MTKISDTLERVVDTLIITGRRNVGFGSRRTDVPRRDIVRIVPTAEFERLMAECAPSGHHKIGLNSGAPVDGLSEYRGDSGIRYLVDATRPGFAFRYADAGSIPEV